MTICWTAVGGGYGGEGGGLGGGGDGGEEEWVNRDWGGIISTLHPAFFHYGDKSSLIN